MQQLPGTASLFAHDHHRWILSKAPINRPRRTGVKMSRSLCLVWSCPCCCSQWWLRHFRRLANSPKEDAFFGWLGFSNFHVRQTFVKQPFESKRAVASCKTPGSNAENRIQRCKGTPESLNLMILMVTMVTMFFFFFRTAIFGWIFVAMRWGGSWVLCWHSSLWRFWWPLVFLQAKKNSDENLGLVELRP